MWQTTDEAEKEEPLLWTYFWLCLYTQYPKQETLKPALTIAVKLIDFVLSGEKKKRI